MHRSLQTSHPALGVRRLRQRLKQVSCSVLTLALTGCSMTRATFDNLYHGPCEYHRVDDDHETTVKFHDLARLAWNRVVAEHPECGDSSPDFAAGFEAAYVDYLYRGGDGRPPVVPPRPYWNIERRFNEDNTPAHDWLAGYQLGSASAQASGIRDATIVPSTGFVLSPEPSASRQKTDPQGVPPEPALPPQSPVTEEYWPAPRLQPADLPPLVPEG